MPTLKLTAAGVANAKPPARGRIEYWDAVLPGFGLRVPATGVQRWRVLYRALGRVARPPLGSYPSIPVAAARERARAMLEEVANGGDPARAKAEARQGNAELFAAVAAEFIERHAKPNNRGWARQARDLEREFLP